jgi:type IV secretion system protein VirB6
MSGLFTAIGGTLENGTATYVTNVSAALASALVPVVTTAVTIWIMVYGLAVVRGEAHEAVPAFGWRALKIALTLAFALSTGVYQAQVVTAVNGATAGVAQTIQNAAAVSGASNPGCGAVNGTSVTASSASSIYQTLDCYDQQIDLVMDAYFDKAAHEGLGLSMVAAAIADFVCGLIAALGGAIFLIVLAFEVVMARMLLDLVLGLGPIFIACAAFGPTARFFEAWTAKVANYALLQVLVAAFLGMALTAFSAYLAPLHVTGAPPISNAASLVPGITAALEDSAADVAAIGLFVTGVFLAMVGWQLPAVASGLAGGATLSGFGAFVAGVTSHRLASTLGRALAGRRGGGSGGNGPRPGGTTHNPSGSGRSPSAEGRVPAYLRAAREHLGQQSD